MFSFPAAGRFLAVILLFFRSREKTPTFSFSNLKGEKTMLNININTISFHNVVSFDSLASLVSSPGWKTQQTVKQYQSLVFRFCSGVTRVELLSAPYLYLHRLYIVSLEMFSTMLPKYSLFTKLLARYIYEAERKKTH